MAVIESLCRFGAADSVGEFPKQRTYEFYPAEFKELMRLRLNSPTVSRRLDPPKTLSSRLAEVTLLSGLGCNG